MNRENLLKFENGKLKNQLIFSLPANEQVCSRVCKSCYAAKFQRIYPNVLPYRERRLAASQQSDFVQRIVFEIKSHKKPLTAVRLHESGEFYSQSYIDSWTSIAKQLPDVKFYTFTKRLTDFDFSRIMQLPNVIIIDSLKHGKINYGKQSYIDSHPVAKLCPATINKSAKCEIDCSYCWSKEAQTHGVKFLQH